VAARVLGIHTTDLHAGEVLQSSGAVAAPGESRTARAIPTVLCDLTRTCDLRRSMEPGARRVVRIR
jgi:hypothetical protein